RGTASTWAARFSARPCAWWAASACRTLLTPAIAAAAAAAPPASDPAISTWTSSLHCSAAVIVFSVAPFRWAWSCSAMTREAISDHLCVVLEFVDQRFIDWLLDDCSQCLLLYLAIGIDVANT